jgi:hypothetical protein
MNVYVLMFLSSEVHDCGGPKVLQDRKFYTCALKSMRNCLHCILLFLNRMSLYGRSIVYLVTLKMSVLDAFLHFYYFYGKS